MSVGVSRFFCECGFSVPGCLQKEDVGGIPRWKLFLSPDSVRVPILEEVLAQGSWVKPSVVGTSNGRGSGSSMSGRKPISSGSEMTPGETSGLRISRQDSGIAMSTCPSLLGLVSAAFVFLLGYWNWNKDSAPCHFIFTSLLVVE